MSAGDWSGDKKARVALFMAWKLRLFYTASAHYRAAERYESSGRKLTVVNMLAAIAVLFLSNNHGLLDGMLGGLGSPGKLVAIAGLITVLTSAFQYVMRFEERSSSHRAAGGEFSNIRRKIERYLTVDQIDNDLIHTINRDYNFVTKSAPIVSQGIWRKAQGNKDEIAYWDRQFEQNIVTPLGLLPRDIEVPISRRRWWDISG